ncbi:MAG: DEAD/DEAH box helicase, partial [Bdellovibrionota bacterium]
MASPPTPSLPVASQLTEIVATLESTRRLVLSAEAGAGKSTLVPKALLESLKGKILVLEPRRVAARLLATYVSKLVNSPLGQKVGYHVRFDRKVTESTRLVYLTEGLLRRYIQNDPFLAGIDAVVIDEFHERSMNADVGLMLLRKIQDELRPDLRILVMSATLDATKASKYLHDAPIIKVPGRGFPVKVSYAAKIADPFDLGEISAKTLQAVKQLLESPDDDGGHVLVFLP